MARSFEEKRKSDWGEGGTARSRPHGSEIKNRSRKQEEEAPLYSVLPPDRERVSYLYYRALGDTLTRDRTGSYKGLKGQEDYACVQRIESLVTFQSTYLFLRGISITLAGKHTARQEHTLGVH